jgi:hypothetical protein
MPMLEASVISAVAEKDLSAESSFVTDALVRDLLR